jgi:hypothetical protein
LLARLRCDVTAVLPFRVRRGRDRTEGIKGEWLILAGWEKPTVIPRRVSTDTDDRRLIKNM